jgi:serine protease inhibitor
MAFAYLKKALLDIFSPSSGRTSTANPIEPPSFQRTVQIHPPVSIDRRLVAAQNEFGSRLFSHLAAKNLHENVSVSPTSVAMAFAFAHNAVDLKGKWTAKFDPSHTAEKPFHGQSGRTTPVPMMSQSGHYQYLSASLVALKL